MDGSSAVPLSEVDVPAEFAVEEAAFDMFADVDG